VCLAPIAAKVPRWRRPWAASNRYVMNDFGGGQRVLKLAWAINFQKLTTIPPSRFLHRVVPQHQPRSLDLFCDAEPVRSGVDSQGLRLSGFEFSQSHQN